MRRMCISSFAAGASLVLSACGAHPPSEGASNDLASADSSPASATGLSPADETAIKASARAFLLARTWGWPVTQPKPCSGVFSVGEPELLDTSLGAQTRQVKIRVPIAAENPAPSTLYGKRGFVPWEDCYGVTDGGWPRGQAVQVTLNLSVERWATGWRVAAVQA